MKKKELAVLYTRINGVVKVQVNREVMPAGMKINQEFHQALGLVVNGGGDALLAQNQL